MKVEIEFGIPYYSSMKIQISLISYKGITIP
jgi:hypothetical protein